VRFSLPRYLLNCSPLFFSVRFPSAQDWQRGLDDCEKCLSIDPKFVKAYIRKGKIQHFLKQYHKALSTYDVALEIEPGNAEVLEAKRATMFAIQTTDSDPERAKQAMQGEQHTQTTGGTR